MSSDVAELEWEVAEVPDGWRKVCLGDLCRINIGGTPPRHKPEYWAVDGGGHHWVSISDLRQPVVVATKERITDAGVANSNVKLVKAGTIMMSFKLTIGRVAVAGTDLFTNEAIAAFVPVSGIDTSFLPYWLARIVEDADTDQAIKGVTLNKQKLAMLSGLLPPLDEQRRIAEVLWSVDEAIAANSATLAATRQIIEKLARDVADGGSEPATIGQLGRVVTGGTPSPKQADLWGGNLPFVTPGDLNEDEVSVQDAARTLNVDAPHGARVLPSGSVLVTCIGSTVGKTAIARRSCVTNQQINAICCDPAISGYVYLACVAAYDEIMANAGKQAVPIINKSTFSAISVPTRSRVEMVAISEMVDALDDEGKAARSALTALNGIKSALMSDLLSGHVRVPA